MFTYNLYAPCIFLLFSQTAFKFIECKLLFLGYFIINFIYFVSRKESLNIMKNIFFIVILVFCLHIFIRKAIFFLAGDITIIFQDSAIQRATILFNSQMFCVNKLPGNSFFSRATTTGYIIIKNKRSIPLFPLNFTNISDGIFGIIFTKSERNRFSLCMELLGISHLSAPSGMHISIISDIIFFILCKNNERKTSYYLVLLCLILYTIFISGPCPSIIRSIIQTCVYKSSHRLKRDVQNTEKTIISSIITIFFFPGWIYSLGLVYSTLCSIAMANIFDKKTGEKHSLLSSFYIFLYISSISLQAYDCIQIYTVFNNIIFIPIFLFVALLDFILLIVNFFLDCEIFRAKFLNICFLVLKNGSLIFGDTLFFSLFARRIISLALSLIIVYRSSRTNIINDFNKIS